MKVLLVVDNPEWAYHSKAKALVAYNYTDIKFSILVLKNNKEEALIAFADNDLYVFFGFQNFKMCEKRYKTDRSKSLVSIASHESWDYKLTQPDNHVLPDKKTIDYLKTFRSVSAVSYRLQLLFKMAGLRDIAYTPNGVLTNVFKPEPLFANKNISYGYAGRDIDQKKGNRTIIEPAISRLGLDNNFKCAIGDLEGERRSGNRGTLYLEYKEMPLFYQTLDVYICASREEGSCRSVLEAMASGCAILTTDSGSTNELIINGYNGLIFDRSVESLQEKIIELNKTPGLINKMKTRNREIIMKYSWKNVVQYWYSWIKANL